MPTFIWRASLLSSGPGLPRPSTPLPRNSVQDVDGRDKHEHDESEHVLLGVSRHG